MSLVAHRGPCGYLNLGGPEMNSDSRRPLYDVAGGGNQIRRHRESAAGPRAGFNQHQRLLREEIWRRLAECGVTGDSDHDDGYEYKCDASHHSSPLTIRLTSNPG